MAPTGPSPRRASQLRVAPPQPSALKGQPTAAGLSNPALEVTAIAASGLKHPSATSVPHRPDASRRHSSEDVAVTGRRASLHQPLQSNNEDAANDARLDAHVESYRKKADARPEEFPTSDELMEDLVELAASEVKRLLRYQVKREVCNSHGYEPEATELADRAVEDALRAFSVRLEEYTGLAIRSAHELRAASAKQAKAKVWRPGVEVATAKEPNVKIGEVSLNQLNGAVQHAKEMAEKLEEAEQREDQRQQQFRELRRQYFLEASQWQQRCRVLQTRLINALPHLADIEQLDEIELPRLMDDVTFLNLNDFLDPGVRELVQARMNEMNVRHQAEMQGLHKTVDRLRSELDNCMTTKKRLQEDMAFLKERIRQEHSQRLVDKVRMTVRGSVSMQPSSATQLLSRLEGYSSSVPPPLTTASIQPSPQQLRRRSQQRRRSSFELPSLPVAAPQSPRRTPSPPLQSVHSVRSIGSSSSATGDAKLAPRPKSARQVQTLQAKVDESAGKLQALQALKEQYQKRMNEVPPVEQEDHASIAKAKAELAEEMIEKLCEKVDSVRTVLEPVRSGRVSVSPADSLDLQAELAEAKETIEKLTNQVATLHVDKRYLARKVQDQMSEPTRLRKEIKELHVKLEGQDLSMTRFEQEVNTLRRAKSDLEEQCKERDLQKTKDQEAFQQLEENLVEKGTKIEQLEKALRELSGKPKGGNQKLSLPQDARHRKARTKRAGTSVGSNATTAETLSSAEEAESGLEGGVRLELLDTEDDGMFANGDGFLVQEMRARGGRSDFTDDPDDLDGDYYQAMLESSADGLSAIDAKSGSISKVAHLHMIRAAVAGERRRWQALLPRCHSEGELLARGWWRRRPARELLQDGCVGQSKTLESVLSAYEEESACQRYMALYESLGGARLARVPAIRELPQVLEKAYQRVLNMTTKLRNWHKESLDRHCGALFFADVFNLQAHEFNRRYQASEVRSKVAWELQRQALLQCQKLLSLHPDTRGLQIDSALLAASPDEALQLMDNDLAQGFSDAKLQRLRRVRDRAVRNVRQTAQEVSQMARKDACALVASQEHVGRGAVDQRLGLCAQQKATPARPALGKASTGPVGPPAEQKPSRPQRRLRSQQTGAFRRPSREPAATKGKEQPLVKDTTAETQEGAVSDGSTTQQLQSAGQGRSEHLRSRLMKLRDSEMQRYLSLKAKVDCKEDAETAAGVLSHLEEICREDLDDEVTTACGSQLNSDGSSSELETEDEETAWPTARMGRRWALDESPNLDDLVSSAAPVGVDPGAEAERAEENGSSHHAFSSPPGSDPLEVHSSSSEASVPPSFTGGERDERPKVGSQPASNAGSRPASKTGSRPASKAGSRPASRAASERPGSAANLHRKSGGSESNVSLRETGPNRAVETPPPVATQASSPDAGAAIAEEELRSEEEAAAETVWRTLRSISPEADSDKASEETVEDEDEGEDVEEEQGGEADTTRGGNGPSLNFFSWRPHSADQTAARTSRLLKTWAPGRRRGILGLPPELEGAIARAEANDLDEKAHRCDAGVQTVVQEIRTLKAQGTQTEPQRDAVERDESTRRFKIRSTIAPLAEQLGAGPRSKALLKAAGAQKSEKPEKPEKPEKSEKSKGKVKLVSAKSEDATPSQRRLSMAVGKVFNAVRLAKPSKPRKEKEEEEKEKEAEKEKEKEKEKEGRKEKDKDKAKVKESGRNGEKDAAKEKKVKEKTQKKAAKAAGKARAEPSIEQLESTEQLELESTDTGQASKSKQSRRLIEDVEPGEGGQTHDSEKDKEKEKEGTEEVKENEKDKEKEKEQAEETVEEAEEEEEEEEEPDEPVPESVNNQWNLLIMGGDASEGEEEDAGDEALGDEPLWSIEEGSESLGGSAELGEGEEEEEEIEAEEDPEKAALKEEGDVVGALRQRRRRPSTGSTRASRQIPKDVASSTSSLATASQSTMLPLTSSIEESPGLPAEPEPESPLPSLGARGGVRFGGGTGEEGSSSEEEEDDDEDEEEEDEDEDEGEDEDAEEEEDEDERTEVAGEEDEDEDDVLEAEREENMSGASESEDLDASEIEVAEVLQDQGLQFDDLAAEVVDVSQQTETHWDLIPDNVIGWLRLNLLQRQHAAVYCTSWVTSEMEDFPGLSLLERERILKDFEFFLFGIMGLTRPVRATDQRRTMRKNIREAMEAGGWEEENKEADSTAKANVSFTSEGLRIQSQYSPERPGFASQMSKQSMASSRRSVRSLAGSLRETDSEGDWPLDANGGSSARAQAQLSSLLGFDVASAQPHGVQQDVYCLGYLNSKIPVPSSALTAAGSTPSSPTNSSLVQASSFSLPPTPRRAQASQAAMVSSRGRGPDVRGWHLLENVGDEVPVARIESGRLPFADQDPSMHGRLPAGAVRHKKVVSADGWVLDAKRVRVMLQRLEALRRVHGGHVPSDVLDLLKQLEVYEGDEKLDASETYSPLGDDGQLELVSAALSELAHQQQGANRELLRFALQRLREGSPDADALPGRAASRDRSPVPGPAAADALFVVAEAMPHSGAGQLGSKELLQGAFKTSTPVAPEEYTGAVSWKYLPQGTPSSGRGTARPTKSEAETTAPSSAPSPPGTASSRAALGSAFSVRPLSVPSREGAGGQEASDLAGEVPTTVSVFARALAQGHCKVTQRKLVQGNTVVRPATTPGRSR